MRVPRPVRVAAATGFLTLFLRPIGLSQSSGAVQFSAQDPDRTSDQTIAQRILGPEWRQLSRRAGRIFVGTVLSDGSRDAGRVSAGASQFSVQLQFRVDRAIAGVENGQILTIREWDGASARLRPMPVGQHVLLFLYPTSRLGLTSPVGGPVGQVALDARGENIAQDELLRRNVRTSPVSLPLGVSEQLSTISVEHLERAIRGARGE